MKAIRAICLACLCAGIIPWSGCSRSNNLLLGRVEATVGTHIVVVTDCYRTSVPAPQTVGPGTGEPGSGEPGSGEPAYRFTPCRDADVLIRGGELLVNGQSYGRLESTDGVLVDHGVVSIQRRKGG